MKLCCLFFCLGCLLGELTLAQGVVVEKIWDQGQHNAFTSLERFQGAYYCAFREAESHIFDRRGEAEGKIRILRSEDGRQWQSVALLSKPTIDLRDPKLSTLPDGRLMVLMGGSCYREQQLRGAVAHVAFSSDGEHYSEPQETVVDEAIRTPFDWIWRVTWYKGTGYAVCYGRRQEGDEVLLSLLKSTDGIHYTLVKQFEMDGFPNETTLRFTSKGEMLMVVRRDAGDGLGVWGRSLPPYTDWKLRKMDYRLGGPDFTLLNKNQVVLGTRSHAGPKAPETVLMRGDLEGNLTPWITLPSGGDTSYPALLRVKDELWVTYYASHEGRASIYFARIPLKTKN